MYISLREVGVFLAVVMALTAGGFLLLTLANINKMVVHLNKKMTEHDQQIQEIIENLKVSTDNMSLLTSVLRKNLQLFEEKLPGSINNLYAFTAALKDAGEKVDYSLEIVQANLAETAATVTESARDLLTYLKIASEGIKMIIGMFMRR